MWCANFVEVVDNEIRAFGNLNGMIYETSNDAWNACISDFEKTKEEFPNAQHYCNSNNKCLRLWDDDEKMTIAWEIQKMNN